MAVDLFGDVDLAAIAETRVASNFPHSLPEDVRQLRLDVGPFDGWMYVGGLENWPNLLDEIQVAAQAPLRGTPPPSLRKLERPEAFSQALHEAGLRTPEWRSPSEHARWAGNAVGVDLPPAASQLAVSPTWLIKPRRGAGGLGVRRWRAGETLSDGDVYLQRQIAGDVWSVACVTSSSRDEIDGNAFDSTTHIIGWSRQLPSIQDDSFVYAGNIAPIDRPSECNDPFVQALSRLADFVGLRGVWGVDFLIDEAGPVVIDVNPRYAASMELYEAAWRCRVMEMPLAAFDGVTRAPQSVRTTPVHVFGKRVVYAPRDFNVPNWTIPQGATGNACQSIEANSSERRLGRGCFRRMADLPHPGSFLRSGWPVCTVFASAPDAATCENRLKRRVDRLLDWIDFNATS